MLAVRDIDRRVLRIHVDGEVGELGLITCVWGWPDSLQRAGAPGLVRRPLAVNVVDAEGGEDRREADEQHIQ